MRFLAVAAVRLAGSKNGSVLVSGANCSRVRIQAVKLQFEDAGLAS